MPPLTYSLRDNELQLHTGRGCISLTPYTSRTVRVRYTLGEEFSSAESLMVVSRPDANVNFTIAEEPDCLIVSTADLTIEIDRRSAAFTYRDNSGRLLTREPASGGKTLTPVDVVVSVFDDSTVADATPTADGVRLKAQNVHQRVDRQAYQTRLDFEWADGEALYGLGSHEEGALNLRGHQQYLYQHNMKAVVPALVSTRGYGIVLDSYSFITFSDTAQGSFLSTDVDDEMDFYFIYGPELDQVVHEVRQLTGQAPMLPKWAFGYLQSKERYESQAELIEIVQEYRRRQLPLDAIVLDWMSWTGDLWGQKTLDPERFPDPAQMMEDLHSLHARLMISIWPIMRPGGDNWREMREQGFLLGNQATYDAFQERARKLYWQQARTGLFAHGIDAWWCDCTEPFEADWHGPVKPSPEERVRINIDEAKRYLDPEYINAYSLLHSQGIYAGQRQVGSDKRVINLTRSAYLGQQRYGTVTWSGDIIASWETMRRQIAEGLNFCATGMPYWTLDVGGFFVISKPHLWFWSGDFDLGVDDLGYRELFVRWFQFATFLPMLRAHGTDTPREIWRFGEPGDATYDSLVKFLRLRYRLLPYVYSLAGWTTQNDYTMLRLLAFDFREDASTHDITDQYMFGPALLVSPVTQPMFFTTGSTPVIDADLTRPVYLPTGTDWYDFWTGERLAGGQIIVAAAGLDVLPLYVRAGSIVPLGAPMQYVDEMPEAVVDLHVYPGSDGSFQLYEDAGDSYDYESGAFSTIDIEWHDSSRQLILRERQGSYPGMLATREFRVLLPCETASGSSRQFTYAGQEVVVRM